ncbi:MAG TPA: glycosyltransferase family 25 protein [Bacteroidales bacterium]|jgi:GR25 family glycosyltransferase involved in LPS biosynthesis|nr:glycosyltransferase family 25 protein [Bacteroidales bacterium]
MKVYVTALKSNKQRYEYINTHLRTLNIDYEIIDAVDKKNISDDDLRNYYNINDLNKIFCSIKIGNTANKMSREIAYNEFLRTNEKSALFLEDDVILPKNISEILGKLEQKIRDDEVILLDYRTANSSYKIGISTVNSEKINNKILAYPLQLDGLVGGAAYILSRKVAENFINLKVYQNLYTIDNWSNFYNSNVFSQLRVLYPVIIRLKPFASSIGYVPTNSWGYKIKNLIEKNKIPFFYNLIIMKRKLFHNTVFNQFYLTDKKSPLDIESVNY